MAQKGTGSIDGHDQCRGQKSIIAPVCSEYCGRARGRSLQHRSKASQCWQRRIRSLEKDGRKALDDPPTLHSFLVDLNRPYRAAWATKNRGFAMSVIRVYARMGKASP